MSDALLERIVDKLNDLDARVRALERGAETDRALEDIRTTLAMMAADRGCAAPPAKPTRARGAGKQTKASQSEGDGDGEGEEGADYRLPVQDPRMWAM